MSGQFDPHDLQSNEEAAASEAWRKFVAEDEGYDREPLRLSAAQGEAIYEKVRETLEAGGLKFLEAHRHAERILTAVRSL